MIEAFSEVFRITGTLGGRLRCCHVTALLARSPPMDRSVEIAAIFIDPDTENPMSSAH